MDWHALLLLSAAGGTQALRTDEELDELPPAASGLRLDRATLLAGNLLSASRIVQARPSLLRESPSISPHAPRPAQPHAAGQQSAVHLAHRSGAPISIIFSCFHLCEHHF